MIIYIVLWVIVLLVGIASVQIKVAKMEKKLTDLEQEIYRLKIMR